MYKISVWASTRVWPARLAIVLLYCLLTDLALFIGDALQLFEITIPLWCFYVAVGLFLAVFLIYPEPWLRHRFRHFYQYQKTCDLVLVTTTFFFLLCLGNQPQRLLQLGTQQAHAASVFTERTGAAKQVSTHGSTVEKPAKKLSKKNLRKLLLQKLKTFRQAYKETSKGGKIALIVLSVIIAAFLIMLVGALSCNIACAGSDGLAILVAILGIGLVTFLLVKVIQRIQWGPRSKRLETPAT